MCEKNEPGSISPAGSRTRLPAIRYVSLHSPKEGFSGLLVVGLLVAHDGYLILFANLQNHEKCQKTAGLMAGGEGGAAVKAAGNTL